MLALAAQPTPALTSRCPELLTVAQDTPAARIIAELRLPPPPALLILNGSTSAAHHRLYERMRPLICDGLAACAAQRRITTISGGTNAGFFALFGQGFARSAGRSPLVGVAVEGRVALPGRHRTGTALEPHHSHVVLVRAGHWGDETALMYRLADALAQKCRSLAVFAGGGPLVVGEMQANLRAGRRMVLLAGSGGITDQVLAARAGLPVADARLIQIAREARIIAFDSARSPAALAELVGRLLMDR